MVKASITEAASRLNVSVDSIRRRLRSGAMTGQRDDRGQWWINLPDDVQPEAKPPTVEQRILMGTATPLPSGERMTEDLINALHSQIDDLRARLDRSETERREDKERAAAERQQLLSLIERLAKEGGPK